MCILDFHTVELSLRKYIAKLVFDTSVSLCGLQISVVCGPCTAGGAYIPTMSDEAVIVKGIGSLYLAGPPLVKVLAVFLLGIVSSCYLCPSSQAATGETISTEDLGGADVHCGISGCTDHYVQTEEEGLETARRIVSSLNLTRMRERRGEEIPVGERVSFEMRTPL